MTESTEQAEPIEVAEPDGQWLCIAFVGHNEYTGYVTEIVKRAARLSRGPAREAVRRQPAGVR